MKRHLRSITAAVAVLTFVSLVYGGTLFAQKMPATLAGTISRPSGKIAFIRDQNVWMMDADGQNQMKVAEVGNADGRLSWSPDGKRIAFTRSGRLQYQEPENSGGAKKIYDVFIAFLDSAKVGNMFWWHRLTTELGGRDPEWSPDGNTITYCRDMNANTVNAMLPNYQVLTMNPEGGNQQLLRKDWQSMPDGMMNPTVSPQGNIAFVHLYSAVAPGQQEKSIKPMGISMLPKASFMTSLDSVKAITKKMANCVAPSWSPDGKWLAYINNDINNSGLYLASADLKQKYLVYQPPSSMAMRPIAPGWSPDSKWLAFSTTDGSIYICDLTGAQIKRLSGPGTDWAPAWSKATPAATSARK